MRLTKGGWSTSLAIMTSLWTGSKHSSSARALPPVLMVWVGTLPLALVKTFTVLHEMPPPQTGLGVGPSPTQSSLVLFLGLVKTTTPLGPTQSFGPAPGTQLGTAGTPANAFAPVGMSW